jgi:N utilization substance protein B
MSNPALPNAARGSERPPGGPSGLRRQAREAALQCLFQWEAHGVDDPANVPAMDSDFWRLRATSGEEEAPVQEAAVPPLPPKARTFAEKLVQGVCAERVQIDGLLEKFASNFRLSRLAAVDRNILRLAVYELLHPEEAPPAVVLNEAIEIAKRFGTEDSGRFVNGLLDRIRMELRSAARSAALPTAPSGPPHAPAPRIADAPNEAPPGNTAGGTPI